MVRGQKSAIPAQDLPKVEGPPIAQAHGIMLILLREVKQRMGDRYEQIEGPYQKAFDRLLSDLEGRASDWEDEWPK